MDRFIVNEHYYIPIRNSDLKSSMDRFIAIDLAIQKNGSGDLKSSMDRFIEKRLLTIVLNTEI